MRKVLYPTLFAIAMVATIYYNGLNHPLAKIASMTLFGLLFVFSLVRALTTKNIPGVFRTWVIWFVIACFVNLVYGSFFLKYSISDLGFYFNMDIALPLIASFSSYYLLDIDREKLPLYMLPICLFAAYCSVSSVLSGLGGFVVAEQYDDSIAKNQIGAAFASIAIISAVFTLECRKSILRLGYGVLSFICIYPALFFSCRTALLSYIIVIVFLVFRNYNWKGLGVLFVLIAMVVLVAGEELRDILYSSIVGNRDVSDFDSMTAGRLRHATLSLDYFLRHPFFGFYGSGDGYDRMPPNAHIFLLYRLTKWGIIGAIPYIALYLSVFKVFLKSIQTRELIVVGILLLAFLESFAEYAPPFGPGSCFIVTFILVGYYLRQES